MANYVTDSNKYKTLVMMLCCDDLERENGNLKKAAEMAEMCQKSGWTAVSMKNDWKTIYGEGVTKKEDRLTGIPCDQVLLTDLWISRSLLASATIFSAQSGSGPLTSKTLKP